MNGTLKQRRMWARDAAHSRWGRYLAAPPEARRGMLIEATAQRLWALPRYGVLTVRFKVIARLGKGRRAGRTSFATAVCDKVRARNKRLDPRWLIGLREIIFVRAR